MKGSVSAFLKAWSTSLQRYVDVTVDASGNLNVVTGAAGGGAGDASAANQTTEIARLTSLLSELQLKADLTETQPVSLASQPLPTGAATEASLSAIKTQTDKLQFDVSNNLKVTGGTGGGAGGDGAILDGSNPALKATVTAGLALKVDGSAVTQPVSGTFWPATQPVSGPLTDTQLRASAVPVSATGTVTANIGTSGSLALETTQAAMSGKLPATLGQKTKANSLAVTLASDTDTLPVTFASASALFKGRASTFRTAGRAGTAGQKILSLMNLSGSAVTVKVTRVMVDLNMTVVKAVTVLPPIIRLWKVTAAPTNGTALTKVKIGGSSSSNVSVEARGDASADGTGSGTTLTATLPAGNIITQEFAPRLITAAGYEMADRIEFLGEDTEITLAAGEGVVVFLDYTAATANPTTDMWIATVEWEEN